MGTLQFRTILIIFILSLFITGFPGEDTRDPSPMVHVPGGSYIMGDVFGDGNENEKPVHEVTVADFYLARREVTKGEFREFVQATGYKTSAENMPDRKKQEQRLSKMRDVKQFNEAARKLYEEFLASGGCYRWDPDKRRFDFDLDCNWRNPGFAQTDQDPVVCMSWNDAASYCNWLNRVNGLPPAYDVDTGELLDEDGRPTRDVTEVRGYRLPTEAEWEYAAREGGKKVRFGNGRNVATSREISFDAGRGSHSYLEKGGCRKGTAPVGDFNPNKLGLHDMSGNAWEWCSDSYGPYGEEAQQNPHPSDGGKRTLRGGCWGGDARMARVFSRFPYETNNRCNNAGFRIARNY